MNLKSDFVFCKSVSIVQKSELCKFTAVVLRKEILRNPSTKLFDEIPVLKKLVSIVNHAYLVGEHSMWKEGVDNVPTDSEDVKRKLDKEMIILLIKLDYESEQEPGKISINENSVIGQILCDTQFETGRKVAEFGMFAIEDRYQKLGLGNFLVSAAEERARSCGCKQMRCELLSPVTFKHDVKTRLNEWYLKLGYRKEVHSGEDGNTVLLEDGSEMVKDYFHSFFKIQYPHLAVNLSTECKLEVFVKEL